MFKLQVVKKNFNCVDCTDFLYGIKAKVEPTLCMPCPYHDTVWSNVSNNTPTQVQHDVPRWSTIKYNCFIKSIKNERENIFLISTRTERTELTKKIKWMSCTETMIVRETGEGINFVSIIIKFIFIFSKDYLIGEKGGHDQNALDGE